MTKENRIIILLLLTIIGILLSYISVREIIQTYDNKINLIKNQSYQEGYNNGMLYTSQTGNIAYIYQNTTSNKTEHTKTPIDTYCSYIWFENNYDKIKSAVCK